MWVDLTIHHRAINRIVYKVVGPSQVIDTQVGRVGRVGSPARPSSRHIGTFGSLVPNEILFVGALTVTTVVATA